MLQQQSKQITKSSSRRAYQPCSFLARRCTADTYTSNATNTVSSTDCNLVRSSDRNHGWFSNINDGEKIKVAAIMSSSSSNLAVPSLPLLLLSTSPSSLPFAALSSASSSRYCFQNGINYFSTIPQGKDDSDEVDNDWDSILDDNDRDHHISNIDTNSEQGEEGDLLSLLSDEESFTNLSSPYTEKGKDILSSTNGAGASASVKTSAKSKVTATKPKKRKRKSKPKPPSKPKSSSTISTSTTDVTTKSKTGLYIPPKQSKRNAQLLFDSIGPHINTSSLKKFHDDINEFTKLMEQECKKLKMDIEDNRGEGVKRKRKKSKGWKKDVVEYKYPISLINAFLHAKNKKKAKRGKISRRKKEGSSDKTNNDDGVGEENENEIRVIQDPDNQWERNNWLKSLLAQFFANHMIEDTMTVTEDESGDDNNLTTRESTSSLLLKRGQMTIGLRDLWNDNNFIPNINRNNYQRNVQTLMDAREMSIKSTLFWSVSQRKKQRLHDKKNALEEKGSSIPLSFDDNQVNVHVALKEVTTDCGMTIIRADEEMKVIHDGKADQTLLNEAEVLATLLADRLPLDVHENVMSMFEQYAQHLHQNNTDQVNGSTLSDNSVESSMTDDLQIDATNSSSSSSLDQSYEDSTSDTANDNPVKQVKQKPPMKMLYHHLERNANFHVHLIAPEVADFLYVDVPWLKHGVQNDATDISSSTTKRDGLLDPYKTFQNDPRLAEHWKSWFSLRDELVKTLMQSQHAYCDLQAAINKLDTVTNESTKLKVKTSMSGIKFTNTEHVRAEQLLDELDMLRTRANGEKVGRDWAHEEVFQGRTPTKANLKFECHMLNDRFGPYANEESTFMVDLNETKNNSFEVSPEIATQLPATNKTILVDNLPIDINEEELEELYSRCGNIKSINIFNLRPDLDPGELTDAALRTMLKKSRMKGGKNVKYNRKRTPVYAIITYEDESGCKRALNDMLRIFGMIIRRHASKSYPARTLNKLHIENIPDGIFAIDIEEKLSKLLHPDMYLSLDIGQHVNSQASSLTLSFPSYEVACCAYEQLKNLEFGSDEGTIHWLSTPDDSLKYWKREMLPES
jgi:hypothetical protein